MGQINGKEFRAYIKGLGLTIENYGAGCVGAYTEHKGNRISFYYEPGEGIEIGVIPKVGDWARYILRGWTIERMEKLHKEILAEINETGNFKIE